MQQKTIHFAIIIGLIINFGVAVGLYRYQQVAPVQTQSPVLTYDNQSKNNLSQPDASRISHNQTPSSNNTSTPAVTVAAHSQATTRSASNNSPKQEEVRQSVKKEYPYYSLRTANDPGYASSWALQKVKAPAAWDIATGNGQTIVAVIDTGFGLTHEDLTGSWLRSSGETGLTKIGDRCWTGVPQDKTNNACDDDGNGYVDDYRGWNFSLSDNNPMTGRTNQSGVGVAHGTQVAGLVGATGNNSTGITTINWQTKIMPLQALSDDGVGYTSDVAAAIYYAVDNGADVINMSLGGSDYDPALALATTYAYDRGVVVVAAAGNCGSGTEQGCENAPAGSMTYPALNDHVISVGATTSNDQRASFSSYGPGLDIVAPGSGTIVSSTWTASNSLSLYSGSLYGTSFAAPQVASLVSLIKSIRPNSTVDDITALLSASASKLPTMTAPYSEQLGHGMIDAERALLVATSLNNYSQIPALLQTGGVKSEHSYTSGDSMGSGCRTTIGTYCTIRIHNTMTGYDRFLPYKLANQQGLAGWTWPASILPTGEWQIQAIQGVHMSNRYLVSSK